MLIALLLSCSKPSPPLPPVTWSLDQISVGQGLSGLGRDPGGGLWAVSERLGELVRLDAKGRIALEGVPEGQETEALTWLSADRIALGTESHDDARLSDPVHVARLTGGKAVVEETLELPFAVLGVTPEANRGLEALCVDGGRLLAISELIIEADGARWAPFATRALRGTEWTPGRLRLSTETGKISGVDCSDGKAWAIERHYGVARILNWEIPAAGGDVLPVVAVPVDELVGGTLPNFEGIAVSAELIQVITDNDYRGKTGPSWLFGIPRD